MAFYSYNSIRGRLATVMVLLLIVFAASSIYVSIQSNRINKFFKLLSKQAEPTITLTFITNWNLAILKMDLDEAILTGNDSSFLKRIKDIDIPKNLALRHTKHCDTVGVEAPFADPKNFAKYDTLANVYMKIFEKIRKIRQTYGLDSARRYYHAHAYEPLKAAFWDAENAFGATGGTFRAKKEELANQVTDMVGHFSVITIIFAITGVLLVIIFWVSIQHFVEKTVNKVISALENLAQGKLIKENITAKGEAGRMLHATNTLVEHLETASSFAQAIGKGKFETNFTPAGTEDVLGHALLNMKNELERFKMADQERNWINVGLAELGEIIRKNNNNLAQLSDAFLKALVKYTGVNQGTLYVEKKMLGKKNEIVLQLMAAYAYGRKKHHEETIAPGEGLIGQVYEGKELLLLTDIPETYVKITSGLGEALPTCVLIVPCINDTVCTAVVELASFEVLPSHKVEFIQKICNTFGAVVHSVTNQEQNQNLLEELRQKTEQMHAQEEALRQNMEELMATQEEMQHKSDAFKELADVVNAFSIIIELSPDGKILDVNDRFVDQTGYSRAEIVGQPLTYYVPQQATVDGSFDAIWKELSKGKNVVKDEMHKKKDGTIFWLKASYMPVFDVFGKIKRITCICYDITEEKIKLEYLIQESKKSKILVGEI